MADGLLPVKGGAAAGASTGGASTTTTKAGGSPAPAPPPPTSASDRVAQAGVVLAELRRRAVQEFWIELPILRTKWRTLALCIAAQYAHGAASQLAHRRHTPAATPLRDAGFELLPFISADWASEALFGALFAAFILWSASPFWGPPRSASFYTVTLYTRTLTALTLCQALRCLAFLATGLPGPAPHCAAGAPTATRPPPPHWWGHAVVDIARQAGHGCGDLIFSSHTTFALSGALAYTFHSAPPPLPTTTATATATTTASSTNFFSPPRRAHTLRLTAVWAAVAVLSLLIIASHKHYSVDVLVAWWTVPLVWCVLERRWRSARGVEGRVALRRCPACGGCGQGGKLPGGGAASSSSSHLHLLAAAEAGEGGSVEVAALASREGTPPRAGEV